MAIKIKRKDDDESSGEGASKKRGGNLTRDADPLLRASWETASWVEQNRNLVLGAIVIVFIALVGGYLGLRFLKQQKVQASESMTPAFTDYNTLIDGSREIEAIKKNPDMTPPKKTFKSDEERWKAVYADASKALKEHPNGDIAKAATLTKAAAAAELGKHDESIKLYEKFLSTNKDPALKAAALQGLATAYSDASKWDDALKTFDKLAKLNDKFQAGVNYEKALVLQQAGKKDKAKKLFNKILDDDPNDPNKADIERRLATM